MNRGLLQLLLCLLLAFMGTPAWAHCRPETRVGGSPVFSSVFASQEPIKPIGTPIENGGCGYDFASGVHKYLYGADNPVNKIDPHGTSDMLIEFKGTNGAASKVDISWPHVADLTSQLNYAVTNHLSITKLYFKGHGDDHDMYLEGGGVLTVSTWTGASEWIEVQNGHILAFQNGNIDITAQMRAVLGAGSVVILDGCHTGRGAGNICHDMSVVLPGVTVIGGRGYHLNVPFAHHTVGVINVYINGDLDGTFY